MARYILTPAGNAALRRTVADEIERLIALLDALDGDTDLEPDAEGEPWMAGFGLDIGDDREWDDADLEPSLGWLGRIEQDGPFQGTCGLVDVEASGEMAGGALLEAEAA